MAIQQRKNKRQQKQPVQTSSSVSKKKKKGSLSGAKASRKALNVFSTGQDYTDGVEREKRLLEGNTYDNVDVYEYELPSDFEDEEIDEDAAFNSEDELLYGDVRGLGLKNTKRDEDEGEEDYFEEDEEKEKRRKRRALADKEDFEGESDEEGLVDLSELLKGEESSSIPSTAGVEANEEKEDAYLSSGADDSDVLLEEEEGDDAEEEEESEAHLGLLKKIGEFYDQKGLEKKYEKIQQKKEKQLKGGKVREMTEAVDESEYALNASGSTAIVANGGSSNGSGTVDLLNMMNVAAAENSNLKKKLNELKKSKVTQLSIPLSKPEKQRMTRDVAYVATKEEVSKWVPLVKKNREADHLSFPANETKGANMNVTTAALVGKFEAQTDLEKGVDAVLESVKEESGVKANENPDIMDSKMDAIEASLLQCEELEFSKLSPAEIEERRTALRKNRALMSYFEQKRRRANKIKSKKYHKIEKKKRERELQKAAEKGEFLSLGDLRDVDPEAAKEEEMKLERQRAEERISLRHKTSKSKWASRLAKRRSLDDDSREAIQESLALQESLKKKIEVADEDDNSDLSGSDIDETEESKKARIENQILRLESEVSKPIEAPKKGLYAMKFMQKAIEAKREAAKAALEELKNELDDDDATKKHNGEEESDEDGEDFFNIAGRKSFGSKQKKQNEVSKKRDSDDEYFHNSEDEDECKGEEAGNGSDGEEKEGESMFAKLRSKISIKTQVKSAKKAITESVVDVKDVDVMGNADVTDKASGKENSPSDSGNAEDASDDGDGENPWLEGSEGGSLGMSRTKKSSGQMGSKSQSFEKGLKKIAKAERKQEEREMNRQAEKVKELAVKDAQKDDLGFDGVSESKLEAEKMEAAFEANVATKKKKGAVKFDLMNGGNNDEQKSLVGEAFANDNVIVKEFVEEKETLIAKETDAELEKTTKVVQPGWGEWGGAGVVFSKRQMEKKQKEEEDRAAKRKAKMNELKGDRADKNLNHVIINEKTDKRLLKKRVTDIPHPFTSREQFENSLRNPLGKEWNTVASSKKLTQPKVSTKAGRIINPIKFTNNAPEYEFVAKRKEREDSSKRGNKGSRSKKQKMA
eukprot:Nk52_evm33s240 gene=Nk52_evmTU33s240